jgi:hypothetical protein
MSPILVTLMMEALLYSEKSVLTGATRHSVSENGFLNTDVVIALRKAMK